MAHLSLLLSDVATEVNLIPFAITQLGSGNIELRSLLSPSSSWFIKCLLKCMVGDTPQNNRENVRYGVVIAVMITNMTSFEGHFPYFDVP